MIRRSQVLEGYQTGWCALQDSIGSLLDASGWFQRGASACLPRLIARATAFYGVILKAIVQPGVCVDEATARATVQDALASQQFQSFELVC
jgi:hypothetical protein